MQAKTLSIGVLPAGAVTATTDPVTGVSIGTSGGGIIPTGSHIGVALVGDSHTMDSSQTVGIHSARSACGFWNWANWFCGNPCDLKYSLAVPGDRVNSIMSRISAIPSSCKAVFVLAGANDVAGVSSSATQPQIDTAYKTITTKIQVAVDALTSAGKVVAIATLPPNTSNYTSDTDSRIQLLDRVNAYIRTMAAHNVFVADIFDALYDSASPGRRMLLGYTRPDGVHLSSSGAFAAGVIAKDAVSKVCTAVLPTVSIYEGFVPIQNIYQSFQTGTGAAAGSNGTGVSGTVINGWTITRSGNATIIVSNSEAYTLPEGFCGDAAARAQGVDERFAKLTIASTADGEQVTVQNTQNLTNTTGLDGVFPGDRVFFEVDAVVDSQTNLKTLQARVQCFFTQGSTPVDQAYINSNVVSATAANTSNFGNVATAYPQQSFSVKLITPIMRVPENVAVASGINMVAYLESAFAGAGGAVIKWGRPRIWRKIA